MKSAFSAGHAEDELDALFFEAPDEQIRRLHATSNDEFVVSFRYP
jgi:hypothetical protein